MTTSITRDKILIDVKEILDKLRRVPYSAFLALFIIGVIVTLYALRHNNQTMVKLRAEVYATDQAGGDVNGALNKLREYVHGHMNTSLSSGSNTIKPPIQLKYTYERLLAAEQAKAQSASSQIYTDAQNYCQQKFPAGFSGSGRIPCVQEYVTSRGVKTTPLPTALYQFNFISPTWSPDLAGWSLVFSILMFLALVWGFSMKQLTKPKKPKIVLD